MTDQKMNRKSSMNGLISSGKKNESKPRVAVVGAGLGGLATAIRLQSAGFAVEIFEKRDQPGGRAYVYRDKGFTFDAGPTVITAPECLEELWQISGRKMDDDVKLVPVTPFYRLLWDDGYAFDYSNDERELFAQIRQKNPSDETGYKRFLEYSKKVFDEGYTKLAATPFLHFWDMVKVAPQLIKLRADRSVYATISKYIKDPHLREAFSFHSLLVGGNPFATSSIYTLIHYLERNWGVFFPIGGTGALVRAMVKLFEEQGGKIHLKSPVEQILTQNGKVVGVKAQGYEAWPCHAVVSNGDVYFTYEKLLREEPLAKKRAQSLKKKKYSMSLFLIYFGTRKKYPHMAHHNVLFGPRYKGLLDDIFYNGVLPEDFSLYLHLPTITDPSLAPEGGETFYVLSPVAHKGNLAVNWKDEGPKYAKKIMEYMERKYLPGLSEHLVTQRIFTPDDFETELGSYLGSAFSLSPILTQSAYFRQPNKDLNIEGLYFAGAGTHPGAGVPGVVNSAKATAQLVWEDFLGHGLVSGNHHPPHTKADSGQRASEAQL